MRGARRSRDRLAQKARRLQQYAMPNRTAAADAPPRYVPVSRYQDNPAEARKLLGFIKRYGGMNAVKDATAKDAPAWAETPDQLVRVIGFRSMDGETWTRWARFWNGPRQIFDLSGPLIREFEQTDVDDIPLTALREPYPECYLHFGPNSTAQITHPVNAIMTDQLATFRVDGVYVHVYRDHEPDSEAFTAMHLDFTTRWVGKEINSPRPRGIAEPSFSARISGTDTTSMRVSPDHPRYFEPLIALQTVREGIADGLAYGEHDALWQDERLRQHIPALVAQVPRLRGPLGPVTFYSDHHRALNAVLRDAIRLTINALFFICNYPAQQRRIVDRAAPTELAAALSAPNLKPAQKTSAERSLKERGFGYVTLCTPEPREAISAHHPHEPVSTHWRRGHWRHQKVGPRRGQIKLTWIRPTLVAADADRAADGRAYTVMPTKPRES